jgi:hypothetical protein
MTSYFFAVGQTAAPLDNVAQGLDTGRTHRIVDVIVHAV